MNASKRRRALLFVIGILFVQILTASPAYAATGCIPNPERVNAGLVASIDRTSVDHGKMDTWFGRHAYAGTRWNTYTYDSVTLFCGDPMAKTDTWLGNQLFNVGKVAVASVNSLWYLQLSGPVFSSIDHNLSAGAQSLYDNAFMPLLSLVLALAVVWILFKTLKGALAHIATKLLWILCSFWLAASSYLMPAVYTTFIDSIFTEGIRDIQGAVLKASGHDPVDGLPTLLYDNVIKQTWLEGEFGSATSSIATEQGPRLIEAQAWAKTDTVDNTTQADLDRKRATWEDVANKVRNTEAQGYFDGSGTARIGVGLLGMFRGVCFAYFPLVAQLGQLLGMLILRLVILFAPVLGLVMILFHRAAPGIVRGLGKALASCVLLAVGSAGYLWVLPLVLKNISSPLLQMVIMAVLTIVALILIRPFRQITGMVSGIVQAAGLNYATQPLASSWAYRTWRRHRWWNKRHKRLLHALDSRQPHQSPTRSKERPEATQGSAPRRHRPEAGAPQRASSTRVPFPQPRSHGPARRAGVIGPRVFYQGPTSQAKQIPPPPKASPPTIIVEKPDTEPDPAVERIPEPPDWQPDPPSAAPVEDLVVPSRYEEQVPGSKPEPQRDEPVIEIYHPSKDRILPQQPVRPENEERGDTDADPI